MVAEMETRMRMDEYGRWRLWPAKSEGCTDLHDAALVGDSLAVQRLLRELHPLAAAAAIRQKGPEGLTALHLAARGGHTKIAAALLTNAAAASLPAAPTAEDQQVAVALVQVAGMQDEQGGTPLHLAAAEGHAEAAALLVTNHPEALSVCDKWGDMPLHRAAQQGQWKVIAALCAHPRAAEVINLPGRGHQTAIMQAASRTAIFVESSRSFAVAVVELLKHPECSTYLQDGRGRTVWHHACLVRNRPVLAKLLTSQAACANMHIRDQDGAAMIGETLNGLLIRCLLYDHCWDADFLSMTSCKEGAIPAAALVLQQHLWSAASARSGAVQPLFVREYLETLRPGKEYTLPALKLICCNHQGHPALCLSPPQSKQPGPIIDLSAKWMMLGHSKDGNVEPRHVWHALPLMQQQLHVSVGLRLEIEKQPGSQRESVQMQLQPSVTCKVIDVQNGKDGFGCFPYEVEVAVEPMPCHGKEIPAASYPAMSSDPAPYDLTVTKSVTHSTALTADTIPKATIRRDDTKSNTVKTSCLHWKEIPCDNARLWKLTSLRNRPIDEVSMREFLRRKAAQPRLPSIGRSSSSVPMKVPGFELRGNTLRVDFHSSEYPGSLEWHLPAGISASALDWKVTVTVRTAFLGTGLLKGFWDMREFQASTLVKLPASKPAGDAATTTLPSPTGLCPHGRPTPSPGSGPSSSTAVPYQVGSPVRSPQR